MMRFGGHKWKEKKAAKKRGEAFELKMGLLLEKKGTDGKGSSLGER